MNALTDFLTHGTLPFTGRSADLERLMEFWRGTFDAQNLRAMLLTGEAGVGKSRLLEETARRIVGLGGAVVHVKIYPESTASLLALIARALWHPDAGRSILGSEPEPSTGAVAGAVRRLARLRATLIVLEDIHLVTGGAVRDLSLLLDAICDETVSLLSLARPVELESRSVLEPYLVEEVTLQGLAPEECAALWEQVTGASADTAFSNTLHDATAGNPLAIRSALRGIVRGERPANGGGGTHRAEGGVALARSLKRKVGLLAEGMTAHLNDEELYGSRQLAALGEVFAREAAAIMLEEADNLIEALVAKGIVATAVAPPASLPLTASEHPVLSFTHSLLHRQLIDHPAFDSERLVQVVADGPLYSILPFRLLANGNWTAPNLDAGTVASAFDRTIKVQIAVGNGSQWRMTELTWLTAAKLVMCRLGQWDQNDWERMLVKLIYHKLDIVRREPPPVRRRWLNYLRLITEGTPSDELAQGRLYALANLELLEGQGNPELTRDIWNEAEAIIGERPHLRFTFAYTDYVGAASIGAFINSDNGMRRAIESRSNELLSAVELPENIGRSFEYKVRPTLLTLFENESELQSRILQVKEYERTVDRSNLSFWYFCASFLGDVAAATMLFQTCEAILPSIREQGMRDAFAEIVVKQQCLLAGKSDSYIPILDRAQQAFTDIAAWQREQVLNELVPIIIDAALLHGDYEYAREVIIRYSIDQKYLRSSHWISLALASSRPEQQLISGRTENVPEGAFTPLLNILFGKSVPVDPIAICDHFNRTVYRVDDLLEILTTTDLVEFGEKTGKIAPEMRGLRQAIVGALVHSLEWLAAPERELFGFMTHLLERYARYFTPKQISGWQRRIAELRKRHDQEHSGTGNGRRLTVSMFGVIRAYRHGEEPQKFQGGRVRQLLGMMVANRMLPEPLSPAEFARLVAGKETVDIENARNILKNTVHRLREAIGHDALLTDGDIPRLNPERVRVDLLEAHELLKKANAGMRHSSPMQARVPLVKALELAAGEVPFPSLYDDFIEAVREDFENELRSVAIDVARALATEGGSDDAAEVLRLACRAVPGDEELAELLHQALVNSGHRAEAERVRMKSEAVD